MSVLQEPIPETPRPASRILSIDALRGFDMFWIMGGDRLVRRGVRLIDTQSPVYSSAQELSLQMTHVAWEDFDSTI